MEITKTFLEPGTKIYIIGDENILEMWVQRVIFDLDACNKLELSYMISDDINSSEHYWEPCFPSEIYETKEQASEDWKKQVAYMESHYEKDEHGYYTTLKDTQNER